MPLYSLKSKNISNFLFKQYHKQACDIAFLRVLDCEKGLLHNENCYAATHTDHAFSLHLLLKYHHPGVQQHPGCHHRHFLFHRYRLS